MNSVLSVLLVVGAVSIAAHPAEPDHPPITCPEQFASALSYSSCQLKSSLEPHFGRDSIIVRSLYNGYVLSKCLEVDRIAHINCRLDVARYIMSTVAVIVIVGSILRLLSGGPASLGASHTYVRPRGRYNSVIGASELVENNSPPLGSAPSFTDRVSVIGRGRDRSVEECASGSNLNIARSSADLAAHLSLITQEPQSGGRSKTVLGGCEYTQEPTDAVPGLQRGSSYPLQQSSPPAIDDTRFHSSNATWGNFIPYFGGRSARTDLPSEPLWARFSPSKYLFWVVNNRLLRSLYGWRPPIFVLVIAVDDATHDHDILELALKSSTSVWVHFSGLATNVTFENIGTSIRQLYDKSMKVPGSELFILLTGHGDDFNRMILPENEFIDEADLFRMLRKIQNDYSRFIPVTTLFDICRLSLKPGTPAPEGVSIAWACLPGQIAGACQFPGPPCPNSCFLIALMMASRTPGLHYTGDVLKKIVQERLDQLTGYLKELYATKHPGGRCGRCSDMLKPCDEPRQQNVDWGDANDLGGLIELTRALSTSEITNSVNQRFMGEEIFCRVFGTPRRLSGDLLPQSYALGSVLSLPTDRVGEGSKQRMGATAPALPDTAHDFNPPLEDNTKKHERGANEHVHGGRLKEVKAVTPRGDDYVLF